ncbi:cytidine deaminase-like protein [Chytriomyces sp. MP71]|nr:cytidine deaminase-like protein [Chytriomyces sp. MP71]
MALVTDYNENVNQRVNKGEGKRVLRRRRTMADHEKWMTAALGLAQEALDVGEVPVGCVVVLDDRIVGAGRNRTNETLNATRHAEFEAIDHIMANLPAIAAGARIPLPAAPSDVLSRADLYVTIEPCVMCASALRHMRFRKVYFGAGNERFGGCGSVLNIHNDPSFCSLQNALEPAYEVESGIFKEEAIMMLRKFYLRENNHAPQPKRKNNRILVSADGH